MKIYRICFFLFASAYGDSPFAGEWVSKVQENMRADYVPVYAYCQKISYIKGGITVKYPVNHFSAAPFISVSVEMNKIKYSSGLSFNPIFTAADSKGFTLYINKHEVGYFSNAFVEADSDDVYVHIYCFGN